MNATSCSDGGATEQGHGHAAERAAGEHQQDEVEADDLARGEQPRGDQPEQPRSHGRSCPIPRRSWWSSSHRSATSGTVTDAVVASLGARFPRRPLRGLGHGLAHRPRVLRRRPRRPAGDTAHRVSGLPGTDEAVPLGWALTALRGLGERRFRLVLPVPGDVRGLPPCRAWPPLALESGQAAVGERLALVPEALGPEAVQWTAFDAGRRPAGGTAGRGHRCARCPARSTSPSATPPARWPASTSPAGTPRCPRCWPGWRGPRRRPGCPTTTTRWRCRCWAGRSGWPPVLDLAMADAPGAAVNHAQAAARDDALRPLADAVRRTRVTVRRLQLRSLRLAARARDGRPGSVSRDGTEAAVAAGRPGAARSSRRGQLVPAGARRPALPSSSRIDGDERRVRAGRRRPGEGQPELGGGLLAPRCRGPRSPRGGR